MSGKRHRDLRWLERTLIATGIVCVSWWGVDQMQRLHYERVYAKAFEQAMSTASSSTSRGDVVLPPDENSSLPARSAAPSSLANDLLVGSGAAIPSNRVARTEIAAGMLGI